MRYIDRSGCKSRTEKGIKKEITTMKDLTAAATKNAEKLGLAVLKTRWGVYRVIKACGLGAGINQDFINLKEVDAFLKSL